MAYNIKEKEQKKKTLFYLQYLLAKKLILLSVYVSKFNIMKKYRQEQF